MTVMHKRITANLYTRDRITFKGDGPRMLHATGDTLFSEGRYATKITAADLPEWYIEGYYRRLHGYMNAKDVKYLLYKPNMWINHMFKDDVLFVSYSKPIQLVIDETGFKHEWADDYDELISGYSIVTFIQAVDKYASDCDTAVVKKLIEEKRLHFKKMHPSDYALEVGEDKPFFT